MPPKKRKLKQGQLDANQMTLTQLYNPGTGLVLSQEQQFVMEQCVKYRKSCYVTGPAGSGKSKLLQLVINKLKRKDPAGVIVCGSTGTAAVSCGGITLHRFAGFGSLPPTSQQDVALLLASNKQLRQKWKACTTLIIEEISMVSAQMFDLLEFMGRRTHNRDEPFGGMQVIAVGDFLQLPPVEGRPCFQSICWSRVLVESYQLTKIFRQSDQRLLILLNCVRVREFNEDSLLALKSLDRPLALPDGAVATKLFAKKSDALAENERQLDRLPGTSFYFEAKYKSDQSDNYWKQSLADVPAEEKLQLKYGAKVMLTFNMDVDNGLVNGSVGTVVKFAKNAAQGDQICPVVLFPPSHGRTEPLQAMISRHDFKSYHGNGQTRAVMQQLPLKLAWALSIHKSQGATLEFVEVDCSGMFECGMLYVALSRARTFDGLRVINFKERYCQVDKAAIAFHAQLPKLIYS